MRSFKYISDIGENELDNNCVISCLNDNSMPCILIKNSLNKTVSNYYSTDNLEVKYNAVLKLHDIDHLFHIITSRKNDNVSINQFKVVFDYVFNKIINPITDDELALLFNSIEEFFRISPESDNKELQIGVFGELLTIKQLYENGYKTITDKYHKNFYSKHDIEISDRERIEIKTTSNSKRIHRFNHDQIYREDVDVYIVSLLLESSEEGFYLYDLFVDVMSLYNNADSIFALQKLMKKCNISEIEKGMQFSLEKAIQDIKCYNATDLPKIDGPAPNGVSDISYDVDCSMSKSFSVKELISIISR